MATYTTLKYGSTGDEVKKLQTSLGFTGKDVDGIFGNKTLSAVKDYQKKNGLAVDGIVGKNTWGALNKASATTTPSPTTTNTTPTKAVTTPKDFTYEDFKPSDDTATADKNRQELESSKPGDFTYADYEKSEIVKQAEALLQQQLANKPGAYQSNWQAQLDETLNKILNREKFSYDLNGDALYQQYKDQFTTQGQQAMMDTMGQAQAMTGGYGNSYAQTVGQQTYQGYLQQLNDKVPELYQIALNQYNQEGQDLYNQYGLYADRENLDYGRYRDAVSDYNTELARLTEDARYQGETDYNRYMDKTQMDYSVHRDAVTDWQNALNRADSEYWNKYNRDYGKYTDDKTFDYGQFIDKLEYDYKVNRDAISDAETKKKYAYDTAMGMLSMGVTPSAEMLKEAGISSADASAITKKVKENEAYTAWKNGTLGEGVDDYTYEETPAVKNFIGRIYIKQEFLQNRSGVKDKYGTYEKYVKAMLEKYDKDLGDNDVATIAQMYGLK